MSSMSQVSILNIANVTAPNADHQETPMKLVLGVGSYIAFLHVLDLGGK